MWIRVNEQNEIVETTEIDPEGRYHPDLVWVDIGDLQAEQRDAWVCGVLVKRPKEQAEEVIEVIAASGDSATL